MRVRDIRLTSKIGGEESLEGGTKKIPYAGGGIDGNSAGVTLFRARFVFRILHPEVGGVTA